MQHEFLSRQSSLQPQVQATSAVIVVEFCPSTSDPSACWDDDEHRVEHEALGGTVLVGSPPVFDPIAKR